jgi:hypothetical protein
LNEYDNIEIYLIASKVVKEAKEGDIDDLIYCDQISKNISEK